jgi:hypothetical protein
MPRYEMLVADELLPELADASNPGRPEGFRVLPLAAPQPGPPAVGRTVVQVEDDNAPPWTEGKLITPTFTTVYEVNSEGHPTGNVAGVTVTDWVEDMA